MSRGRWVARTCHTVFASRRKSSVCLGFRVVPLPLRCSINPACRGNGAMRTAGTRFKRGISYEKIAFAYRALWRDGARIWGLCSACKRRAASDRTSRAEDRSGRRRSGCALSLLVARWLSPLRLRRSSRLASRLLAPPSLASSPLAAPSRLAQWLLRPPPLLLSVLRASVLRLCLSPAVCVLHRLVLVVKPQAMSRT